MAFGEPHEETVAERYHIKPAQGLEGYVWGPAGLSTRAQMESVLRVESLDDPIEPVRRKARKRIIQSTGLPVLGANGADAELQKSARAFMMSPA